VHVVPAWALYAALAVAPCALFARTYAKWSGDDARAAFLALWPSALMALLVAITATQLVRMRGLGAPVGSLAVVVASALPLGLLSLVHRSMQLAHPAARAIAHREPYCLEIAALVLCGSLFVASRGLKHGVAVAIGWRSAALGAAAGAWTALTMLLYCPDSDWGHLVVKHMAPVWLAPVLGAWFLRRYLAV
jgi:hypothetical protein